MRHATLLDRAVAVMVLMGWCAMLWNFYSRTAK